MHATASSLSFRAHRLAALALALSLTGAGLQAAPKDKDAFPTFDSYIKVSGQAADVTGIPVYNVSSLNPFSSNRKIVASLLELDEKQQNLSATLTHTVGNTE